MNVIILGIPDKSVINAIKESSYLEKLYIASPESVDNIPNIDFTDFDDLINKIKVFKTDIVITFDRDLISAGIYEKLRENRINIISVNKKWLNLENSRIAAKQLLTYYGINTPEIIKAPVEFPVVLKTDTPGFVYKANSIMDLTENIEKLSYERFYTEEFLDGKSYEFIHIWDGENIYTIPSEFDLTEIQFEKLKIYTTKLNFMLSDEKADFAGFFTSKMLWAKNDWYVLKYKMGLDKYAVPNTFKKDFLFLLNLIIYRKLNEL